MHSDEIKGVTFDYQLQTAAQMASVLRAAFGRKDGVLHGCGVSVPASTAGVEIASGDVLVCGRHIQFLNTLIVPTQAFFTEGDKFVRLLLKIDVSTAAENDRFTQASIEFEYANAIANFGELTQEDVNHDGFVYDCEICVASLDVSGRPIAILRSWQSVMPRKTTIYKNVSVSADGFVSDTTFDGFPYRADIPIPGVTEDDTGSVLFNSDDALSGMYAPTAVISDGYVSIFARSVPTTDIILDAIEINPEPNIVDMKR